MSQVPEFLVIGAQKAGTTWLAQHLTAHPGIYSPKRKELHFFDKADNWQRGPGWYAQWFTAARDDQLCGEYTPNYLWEPDDPAEIAESGHLPGVASRVHAWNPNLRWIAVLRDPVDRAVSAYYHQIRARRIQPGQPLATVWHRFGIRSMGLYTRQLRPWMDAFPPEQGRVLFFESDILQQPSESLRALYTFLGVDSSFHPTGLEKVHNPGSSHFLLRLEHRTPLLARILQKMNRRLGASWTRFHIPVHGHERDQLRAFYAEPDRELAALLGKLPPWMDSKNAVAEWGR